MTPISDELYKTILACCDETTVIQRMDYLLKINGIRVDHDQFLRIARMAADEGYLAFWFNRRTRLTVRRLYD